MNPYRVLVVGLGKRGMHHAHAFNEDSRFDLVGICDQRGDRLRDAAGELSVETIADDARVAAKSAKPDVFCFCTMPDVRYELVEIGVECGASLIAFEKPMALSLCEADKIMTIVREAGVRAVVCHQHRYGEHYQKVRHIIESGQLGRVHTIHGTSCAWMAHLMTHLVDYMRWYNDNVDAQWVMAQAAGRCKLSDRQHPSPDYIAGVVHFANGVQGIIDCGAGAPDVPEVDYWWRKCRIIVHGTLGFAEVLTNDGWRAVTREGASMGEGRMDYEHDMRLYVADIAEWLADPEVIHPCNVESAYKGFEIVMAMCRSVVQRAQIPLPLTPGSNELDELVAVLPDRPVIPSTSENASHYLPQAGLDSDLS
ncbi:MAG: Gfo/Idh/MocA family oxidoreductase [Phycisphaerae bacterium]|nr:Gfo/Idh/MocA family oxidoreductase [Phycisphaerae bacterium]